MAPWPPLDLPLTSMYGSGAWNQDAAKIAEDETLRLIWGHLRLPIQPLTVRTMKFRGQGFAKCVSREVDGKKATRLNDIIRHFDQSFSNKTVDRLSSTVSSASSPHLRGPVHFLSPDRESGVHCLIICGIQLLTPNNLGETRRRICSLDIWSISALEVLRNRAL